MLPIRCVFAGVEVPGKTTLVKTYMDKTFCRDVSLSPFKYFKVQVKRKDGSSIELDLCDTTGCTEYRNMQPLWYPNTEVFLILFSVLNGDYSEDIKRDYLPNMRMYCPNAIVVLVGTQNDRRLDDEKTWKGIKPLSYDYGQRYASEIGAVEYIECSARTGEGMSAVFDAIVKYGLIYRSREKLRKCCHVM